MPADEPTLRRAATAFRRAIDDGDRARWDCGFDLFPNGTCGVVCELLGRYLEERYGLEPLYIVGKKRDGEKFRTHAWLMVDGFIIDITADQFGQAPVIVARDSPWHAGWQSDGDEPRRVITPTRGSWPFYPAHAWHDIAEALKQVGEF